MLPHRLLVHAHQHRILERIGQRLGQLGMGLGQHPQLLPAGDRRPVGLRPACGRRRDHFGPAGAAGDAGAADPDAPAGWPPFVLPIALTMLVALKMNLPNSCSRLIAPWVMVMV